MQPAPVGSGRDGPRWLTPCKLYLPWCYGKNNRAAKRRKSL